jgi:Integrase core domain
MLLIVSSLDDAQRKLAKIREHYNEQRPHSALADRAPDAFAALQGKAGAMRQDFFRCGGVNVCFTWDDPRDLSRINDK